MMSTDQDILTGSDDNDNSSRESKALVSNQPENGSQEEIIDPWPSTFQRSISLLSTPVLNARKIEIVTKSPKPGNTPILGGLQRNLRRGFNTPDPAGKRGIYRPSSRSYGSYGDLVAEQQNSILDDLNSQLQLNMKQKQEEMANAQKYRQEILKNHQAKKTKRSSRQDETKSPGYNREKKFDRHAKQQQSKVVSDDKTTFLQCVFNMSNILMGVGMLGLPFVFKSAGWFGGSFVILLFSATTWMTSKLIGRQLNGDPRPCISFDEVSSLNSSSVISNIKSQTRLRRQLTSFPQIAREAFGEWGNIILSSVLYFELFSCLCIFLVTITDHFSSLFPSFSRSALMIAVAGALSVPTVLLRTPQLLSYLSMVGTFATVLMVLAVFSSALFEGDISREVAVKKGIEESESSHVNWQTSGLPVALGLVAYCFSGHAIVPSIYSSMKRPQYFESMIDVSFLIVLGSCFVVAISGYYMFGSMVDDQVTISLEQNSAAEFAMKSLTWLMILTAFSKFALTMFPLALGMEEIVAPYVCDENVMNFTDSIIKMSLILCALAVAFFVRSFSFICTLVGLVCSMTVSVIFPASAHLALFGPKLSFVEKVTCWIFVCFGTIVAIVGTMTTIRS